MLNLHEEPEQNSSPFFHIEHLIPQGFLVSRKRQERGVRAILDILDQPLAQKARESLSEWGFDPSTLRATPKNFHIVHEPRSVFFQRRSTIWPAYYVTSKQEGRINVPDFLSWIDTIKRIALFSHQPIFYAFAIAYAEELVTHHHTAIASPSPRTIEFMRDAVKVQKRDQNSFDDILYDLDRFDSFERFYWHGVNFMGVAKTSHTPLSNAILYINEIFAKYFTNCILHKALLFNDKNVSAKDAAEALARTAWVGNQELFGKYWHDIQEVIGFIHSHDVQQVAQLYFSSSLGEKALQVLFEEESDGKTAQNYCVALQEKNISDILAHLDHVWPKIS